MLISQKSKEIIDSCRFCWMCRHICPIGNVTGQERNTARARMLALSLVERGAEPLTGVADNIYECALCGACTKDCATGWDPVTAVKEVRTELAMNGETPDYILKLIGNIQEYGNVYAEKNISSRLSAEIDKLPKKADTLLFLGRDAIFKSTESALKAIELLKKAKIDFTVLKDEPDSGYAMEFLTGKTAESKEIAEKCAKMLDFKNIVCYDPSDAKIFMREYKEWDIKLSATVYTFTSFVAKLIKNGNLKVKNSGKVYTVQDSALLARDLDETDAVREIIAACGENREMLCFGKDTILAGNLIMNEYMPKVMKEVAESRWVNAKNMGAEILVTENPAEYALLKSVKPENIKLMTIEEVVLKCLQD
mgnify:CR=1 FL=1